MMEVKKVIVAAQSVSYCNRLRDAINAHDEFQVVDIATDGFAALEAISEHTPDILILDLVLPRRDGISIQKNLCKTTSPPAVIATTIFISDYVRDTAMKYGASYLLEHPVSPTKIVEHMLREDFTNRLADPFLNDITMDRDINHMLTLLNIPQNHPGYIYIYDAVEICILNPDAIYSVKEQIYQPLGRKHFLSPEALFRNIKKALEQSFANGGVELFAKRLYCYPLPGEATPTPAQCIASIAEKIRVRY